MSLLSAASNPVLPRGTDFSNLWKISLPPFVDYQVGGRTLDALESDGVLEIARNFLLSKVPLLERSLSPAFSNLAVTVSWGDFRQKLWYVRVAGSLKNPARQGTIQDFIRSKLGEADLRVPSSIEFKIDTRGSGVLAPPSSSYVEPVRDRTLLDDLVSSLNAASAGTAQVDSLARTLGVSSSTLYLLFIGGGILAVVALLKR